MYNQKWEKLWDVVTSLPDGDATITPTDNINTVILTWPDGSKGVWEWREPIGDWRMVEGIDTAPCDVAARDSL